MLLYNQSFTMATTERVITSLPASGSNVNKAQLPDNALVLPPTAQLQALLTIIRDEKTQRYVSSLVLPRSKELMNQGRLCLVSSQLRMGVSQLIKSTSDRIIRLLVEEGMLADPICVRAKLRIRFEPPPRRPQNGQDTSRYELRRCFVPRSNMRCINHAR